MAGVLVVADNRWFVAHGWVVSSGQIVNDGVYYNRWLGGDGSMSSTGWVDYD